MSALRQTVNVVFDCGHWATLLREEYGDGSAWCIPCDEFQTYARCSVCGSLDCECIYGPHVGLISDQQACES